MSRLRATMIDVGWGDSLLLEAEDGHGTLHYGLVDCNDSVNDRSSYVFLKRYFDRKRVQVPFTDAPIFEWVVLSHAHADHGQGLKRVLHDFGTKQLWYPKSFGTPIFFTDLLRFATRSPKVLHHQVVDTSHVLPPFGDAQMGILWPHHGSVSANENDNSIVLTLTLGHTSFVLTGDAEAEGVWSHIAGTLPSSTTFFKVPHHGATNGTFDARGDTPWIKALPSMAKVGLSSHVNPFPHPSQKVVQILEENTIETYRTDEHYHITFETDGSTTTVQFSHV